MRNKKRPKPEFRYNRKRRHFSYIYKFNGDYRHHLLLSSKKYIYKKGKIVSKNIPLYKNPNPNNKNKSYIMKKKYIDHKDTFDATKKKWKLSLIDKIKLFFMKK